MILYYGLCLALFLRSALCYFITHAFPYGALFNYQNIPLTPSLIPVIVPSRGNFYPELEGKNNEPRFLTNSKIFKGLKTSLSDLSSVIVKDPNDGNQKITEMDEKFEEKQSRFNLFNNRLFKNFKTTLDVTFNREREDPLIEKCREKFGGTLVNNECYKFYMEELKWNEARQFCKEKGGGKADLWTPDPTDAFLYQKLSYLMPEFGMAIHDVLWTGAKFDHAGEKILDLNKEDITDTFLMNIHEFPSMGRKDECVGIGFPFGGFVAGLAKCEDRDSAFNFICEFPLEEEAETGFSKNMLNLFKNKLKF